MEEFIEESEAKDCSLPAQDGQPSSAQRRATCGITDSVTVSHAPRQEWCCHST